MPIFMPKLLSRLAGKLAGGLEQSQRAVLRGKVYKGGSGGSLGWDSSHLRLEGPMHAGVQWPWA